MSKHRVQNHHSSIKSKADAAEVKQTVKIRPTRTFQTEFYFKLYLKMWRILVFVIYFQAMVCKHIFGLWFQWKLISSTYLRSPKTVLLTFECWSPKMSQGF